MEQEQLIKDYVDAHLQEAIELLEKLGKIPAPSRHEEKRAEFCMRWFMEQGADEVWIDEAKNVICAVDCDKYEDIAVFMAHTDIVFPDKEELPMRREGKKLYAPGIGDDTANLVNLMMAAKYFLNHKIPMKKGVLFVANSCEEGLGNLEGCKEIFNNFGNRITEFYSFDGYMSQCTSIPVGSYRYRISVKGDGGHSYLDFGNENAVCTMASLIQGLYEVEVPTEEKTTYNVGYIEGGTTVNSIPQEAVILYEYRSPSQKCLSDMEGKFNKIISDLRSSGKRIKAEILGIRPGKGEMNGELLKSWTENNISIIKKYYDGPMDIQPYSTDGNIPLSRGVLANTIGTIVGGGAHKREEWVDLDSIPAGMSIALALMLQYVKEA
ncbi:M20/M25/M40 family metallo-hydrolase [Petroclostridium sp. X23]|uniref:M20/M25/M40 family metallo-hydrolase n=1 Tax=Petroclostridium sp. X23 TaxID=3045146 RepID=UPI0024AE1EC5|nr:M20/M25/M40 family metallo-hydrolase [Petroclostridium sp. X23]WHH57797.1 M20/M25/M40 family metallo-hydrolase [Petroclostridium sp. X23]